MDSNQTFVGAACQSGLARELRELAENLHTHATNNAMRSAIGTINRAHVHELIARAEVVIMRSRELLSLMGEEVPA